MNQYIIEDVKKFLRYRGNSGTLEVETALTL